MGNDDGKSEVCFCDSAKNYSKIDSDYVSLEEKSSNINSNRVSIQRCSRIENLGLGKKRRRGNKEKKSIKVIRKVDEDGNTVVVSPYFNKEKKEYMGIESKQRCASDIFSQFAFTSQTIPRIHRFSSKKTGINCGKDKAVDDNLTADADISGKNVEKGTVVENVEVAAPWKKIKSQGVGENGIGVEKVDDSPPLFTDDVISCKNVDKPIVVENVDGNTVVVSPYFNKEKKECMGIQGKQRCASDECDCKVSIDDIFSRFEFTGDGSQYTVPRISRMYRFSSKKTGINGGKDKNVVKVDVNLTADADISCKNVGKPTVVENVEVATPWKKSKSQGVGANGIGVSPYCAKVDDSPPLFTDDVVISCKNVEKGKGIVIENEVAAATKKTKRVGKKVVVTPSLTKGTEECMEIESKRRCASASDEYVCEVKKVSLHDVCKQFMYTGGKLNYGPRKLRGLIITEICGGKDKNNIEVDDNAPPCAADATISCKNVEKGNGTVIKNEDVAAAMKKTRTKGVKEKVAKVNDTQVKSKSKTARTQVKIKVEKIRRQLTTAERQDEAYKRIRERVWIPPRSPHNLLQEYHSSDPWRVIVICMLLNQTTGLQAKRVLLELFELCPNAEATIGVDNEKIATVIRSLGLQQKRAAMIKRMSVQYLDESWTYVTELAGVGKYAADAYAMFCTGKWENLQPDDHKLVEYWEFLKSHFGH